MTPDARRRMTIAAAMTLSWITFFDRAAIGQGAPLIARDLGLSPVQMGSVFSAFGLAYALLEIPAGMYCDRKGPRKVLTRIVVWWSLFTMATGGAWSFASLWVTRFLFGAGEAGCYPSLARVFRTWLPAEQRPLAEGLKAASSRLGAAMAPSLVVALLAYVSWRGVFVVFGCVGLVWAAAFYAWFRDRQEDSSTPETPDRRFWGTYLASRSLWMLSLQWFCHFYAFYFYITWLPTYLQQARGVDAGRSAILAGLPVFTAGAGSLVGGWVLSVAIRKWNDVRRARKSVAYVSYLLAAVFLALAVRPDSAEWSVAWMSLSSFAAEFSGPISWTSAMDLGGKDVGLVSGAMNSIGQMGGAVAPSVVGYFAQTGPQGWTAALYSGVAVYLLGFLCWLYLDPVTPLAPQDA